MAGSVSTPQAEHHVPLWLVAELTYRCPLRCPYCSNPLNHADTRAGELSTAAWLQVLQEARKLGAVQLGFTGGEPLLRPDLESLVAEARKLGFYSNLITSGIGLSEERCRRLADAGIDHVQLSFQASRAELNDRIGGGKSFERKREAARVIRANGLPMVMNVVLHRENIDTIDEILALAVELDADALELANTQFEGWALRNSAHLLSSLEQVERAFERVEAFRAEAKRSGRGPKVFFVRPDYYESRPKPCSAGWGRKMMLVTPDGIALPCHAARKIPGIEFPNVTQLSLAAIWNDSPAFNAFRGNAWMKAPCSGCPEKENDFGGCRCQAFALTGDPANADPVCERSPHRNKVDAFLESVRAEAKSAGEKKSKSWEYRT
jgi:pyrroloquinoline quinone biosynthesis protein E